MGKTEENLQEAFAGESQANRKYLAFANKADKEGFGQAAKLFRAAAAAETIHAHAHLRALKAVGTTAENLKESVAGETHEFKNMYPQMIKDAEAEGHKAALRSFQYANAVEKEHAALPFIRRYWTVLKQRRLNMIITSVQYAGIPTRKRPRRSARFAAPTPMPFLRANKETNRR
jgi:rubrerythrin